jgi:alcohol dehydrogenase (cytochrome c)
LFTSTYDGTVWALDDESLKPPWSLGTGCFSAAAPMTCAVNGKQYVAILIGNRKDFDQISKRSELKDQRLNTYSIEVFCMSDRSR